jgi:hypothetical protein
VAVLVHPAEVKQTEHQDKTLFLALLQLLEAVVVLVELATRQMGAQAAAGMVVQEEMAYLDKAMQAV